MKIRSLVGESGKPVLDYVAESDEDREALTLMALEGRVPHDIAQKDPPAGRDEAEGELE